MDFVREGELTKAIDEVSFEVQPGEFVAIIGPSGSGKSTLLNAIAGLLQPTRGTLVLAEGTRLGYVFQQDALLPWRRAIDNVSLTLELRGVRRKVAHERAEMLLHALRLDGFERHWPHELSGGMRKRVGLAAALIDEPNVILMDEPYGALDAQTRLVLQDEVLALWRRERQTVILVTHDLEEAVSMADRVIVLSARPAVVRRVLEITLPRERTVLEARGHAAFHDFVGGIWEELKDRPR